MNGSQKRKTPESDDKEGKQAPAKHGKTVQFQPPSKEHINGALDRIREREELARTWFTNFNSIQPHHVPALCAHLKKNPGAAQRVTIDWIHRTHSIFNCTHKVLAQLPAWGGNLGECSVTIAPPIAYIHGKAYVADLLTLLLPVYSQGCIDLILAYYDPQIACNIFITSKGLSNLQSVGYLYIGDDERMPDDDMETIGEALAKTHAEHYSWSYWTGPPEEEEEEPESSASSSSSFSE